MKVLGICEGHDCGAALSEDGKMIAAVNEERLTRLKNQAGFPEKAIREVIDMTGTEPGEVGVVYTASYMTPVFALRLAQRRYKDIRKEHSSFSKANDIYRKYQCRAKGTVLEKVERAANLRLTRKRLERIGLKCRIEMIEHHLAHAGGCLLTERGDRLVVTMDDIGDGVSSTISRSAGGKMKRLFEQDAMHSAGDFYAKITEVIGFRPGRDEGKVVGLAAKGDALKAKGILELLKFENSRIREDGLRKENLTHIKKEDIAAAGQEALEKAVCGFVNDWAGKTGMKKIVLSGGVFSNVKLNQRIMEKGLEVSVYPHMGDGGLAAGSLGIACGSRMDGLYLGREYSGEEIEEELEKSGLEYGREKNVEKNIAKLISEQKIIGRHTGRAEFGPRALGNRSILFGACDERLVDKVNKKLGRDGFMPFAPATLAEKAGKCYKGLEGSGDAGKHMTMSFDCTDWMKKNSPAAVHVDGTARPQIVDEATNQGFHKMLKEYEKSTGIPTVINTSFNMHDEPIVYSPKDAIRAYKRAGLDFLAIGEYLAR